MKSAIIVDDVFDLAPKPNEITDWPNFIGDLSKSEKKFIADNFVDFGSKTQELIKQEDFCEFIWDNQKKFKEGSITALLSSYETSQNKDKEVLDTAVTSLVELGYTVSTIGRDFVGASEEADLLVVDLFLGSLHQMQDYQYTISKLKEIVKNRQDPPLVLLMSNSGQLEAHKSEFRDKAGLYSSCFRVIEKKDIPKVLSRRVNRLESTYEDAKKVARFHLALESSVHKGVSKVISSMKLLELHDYAQIRDGILKTESEQTGSYLIDVFDRMISYNIEGYSDVIDAAHELNAIDLNDVRVPHVHPPSSFLDISNQICFVNPVRLKLREKINFGDLIKMTDDNTKSRNALKLQLKPSLNNVFLVITPACKLLRMTDGQVLMIKGELVQLTGDELNYPGENQTSIFELEGVNYKIKWKLDLLSVEKNKLDKSLSSNFFNVVGRLRETQALELRQNVFSSIGGVGNIVTLPKRVIVNIDFYYRNIVGELIILDDLSTKGWCINGKMGNKPITKLNLGETCCEAVINNYVEKKGNIHTNAKRNLEKYLGEENACDALHSGITIVDKEKPILSKIRLAADITSSLNLCCMIVRGDFEKFILSAEPTSNLTKAGVIMNVHPLA